jgi:aquaporin Z
MTFVLTALILCMLSRYNTLRLTPLIVWILVTFEVLLGASISGTSLNPARSFGPAVVMYVWQAQWIYFIAPTLGALLAVAAYRGKIFGNLELKTAKLFHTPSYRCIFLNCKECEFYRIKVRGS